MTTRRLITDENLKRFGINVKNSINSITTKADAAAEKANAAADKANTAATEAERVNVTLNDSVISVTNRDGETKTMQLASLSDVGDVVEDVKHMSKTMGAYTDRADIILTAKETNVAVSAEGVKVSKQGWAIAEFTAEKGNVYLFKPNVIDGSVCIFSEYIQSVETRGIDYTYTYNTDGTVASASATYLGTTHIYTYTYAEDKSCTITDETGAVVNTLPMVYETKVGTYSPLVSLNANAELPKDGYCRYMSHFKGNSAIKVAVSYKMGVADLTMKVTRDDVLASISTQLGNLSQKEDETRKKMEDLHGSWVDVKYSKVGDNYFMKVDSTNIIPQAMQKIRIYPKYNLSWGRQNAWVDISARKILFDVSRLDTSKFTNMSNMFSDCSSLTTIDVCGFDTSKVTNMSNMFTDCSSLTTIDVSGFDTSKVTNMSNMFTRCKSLTTIDVSGFDTSKVTNMSQMFNRCKSLKKIVADIDTSALENATNMFGDTFSGSSITSILLGTNFFKMPLTNLSFSYNSSWKDDTVKQSLVTNSYDRKSNGLPDLTLTLNNNTKKVLTEGDIDTMTAKGYIIA